MSQLSKCLKFKSVRGDKNDCILYKVTPRNVTNFRHLLSCDTIGDIHDISMSENQSLNLWESQRLCLLNTEKFAKGTFTWANNNNVNEISVIDYVFSSYDFLPNVVSSEIGEGKTLPIGDRKRRERHFLTIMQLLFNSKLAESHITMWKKGWQSCVEF